MDELYQLGENIRKRREELGLSQRDLASTVGYSDHTTITKMEKGNVDVTIRRLSMIAEALKTTPAKLAGWDIQEKEEN